jgi:proprotein convertase subtilisin/kexin type 5
MFSPDGVVCIACTASCMRCNTTTGCISCIANYYLPSAEAACLPCGLGNFSNNFATVCSTCSSIYPGCINCSGVTCFACQYNYYLTGNDCSNGINPCICQPCSFQCYSCSSSPTNCTACMAN